MNSKFRALATALLLGSATVASMALVAAPPAMAAAVRASVGNALKAAISAATGGNGSAANAKIREAEGVPNLTSSEQEMIAKTKEYVAFKTGGSATGAKAKFAADYNRGLYSAVVGPDADLLRKYGAMDGTSALIVAQAYYLMHNYDQCVRHIKEMGHVGQSTLELLMRCAYEEQPRDEQTMQFALEQLVVDNNQPKYWADLLDSADRTDGLSNPDTLDIYRIRLLTGTLKAAADFETATEIAIQLGFPTEAEAFAQKGLDLKMLAADRGAKLLNLAKTQAAIDTANLPKAIAAANAAKTGDAGVKLGEDYWGMGRYQDALAAIKAGIAKGASNPDEAQIRLAMAYIGLRQREAAIHALSAVSKTAPAHTLTIARLWSIYARTH